MAIVEPKQGPPNQRGDVTIMWDDLHRGDEGGSPISLVGAMDLECVQVEGEFAGSVCLILGSIDGKHFRKLTDAYGNQLVFDAPSLKQVNETCGNVIPSITAGDENTNLTVTALFRRSRP